MKGIIQSMSSNALEPANRDNIPKKGYMVYVLGYNGQCIVCGRGQRNRAKVIFDDENHVTSSHIKCLTVRIYQKYGRGRFDRFIIPCKTKEAAKSLEKRFHDKIGGNSLDVPEDIRAALLCDLDEKTKMIMEMALCSAYSGLRDLKTWQARGILDDVTWNKIQKKLGTW